MPAIIRVTINTLSDAEAIEVKQQIEALTRDVEGVQVEITITPPR